MEKNLFKLDNEPLDDDFEKLFMDYLKEELSSDDSNTDKEDTTDGDANDDEERYEEGHDELLHDVAVQYFRLQKHYNRWLKRLTA